MDSVLMNEGAPGASEIAEDPTPCLVDQLRALRAQRLEHNLFALGLVP